MLMLRQSKKKQIKAIMLTPEKTAAHSRGFIACLDPQLGLAWIVSWVCKRKCSVKSGIGGYVAALKLLR